MVESDMAEVVTFTALAVPVAIVAEVILLTALGLVDFETRKLFREFRTTLIHKAMAQPVLARQRLAILTIQLEVLATS